MNLKVIDNHRLYRIDHHVLVEHALLPVEARLDVVKVLPEDGKAAVGEWHYGIEKQRQGTLHAIVALWGRHLDEAVVHIDDLGLEILACDDVLDHAPLAHDHRVVALQVETSQVEREFTLTLIAQHMGDVVAQPV